MTDNDKLHKTHELLTNFRYYACGCIKRDDGQHLRRCHLHTRPR